MGKSEAAKWLCAMGLAVLDTDNIARELVEPGQPALAEVSNVFGAEVVGHDGRLLREKLAGIVFNNAAARSRLESILHPRITACWRYEIKKWRRQSGRGGAVVIPLLFETSVESDFDAVICVACTPATQRERLTTRGWMPDEIVRRNAAQWPVERKMAAARYVLWSEGKIEAFHCQLDRIFQIHSSEA